jgi:hypothetical protein
MKLITLASKRCRNASSVIRPDASSASCARAKERRQAPVAADQRRRRREQQAVARIERLRIEA